MFRRVNLSTYQKPEVFLAVFRVLLGMAFLGSYELHNIDVYIPLDAPAYSVMVFASYLIYVCSVFVIIGYLTNVAWFVMVCSSGYTMYWLQVYNHSIHLHHLWWCAVILCLAPVGIISKQSSVEKTNHTLYSSHLYHPIMALISILSCVFLFPAIHKIFSIDWISGDIIRYTIAWKQTQHWSSSWYFIDQFLDIEYFSVVALGVAILEFYLVWLLWHGKYILFICMAGVFHGSVWIATDITFGNLWILYPSLLFLPQISMKEQWIISKQSRQNPEHHNIYLRQSLPSTVYSFLIIGILYAGITKKQSGFPWVCYPTFTQPISKYMPLLAIQIVDTMGKKYPLDYRIFVQPHDQAWRNNWKLAGLGYPVQPVELERYFQEAVGVQNYLDTHPEIMSPHTIEFYYAHIDTMCRDEYCTNQESPIRLIRRLHTYTRK